MLLYTCMKKIFIKKMLIEAAADSRSTEYLPRKISAKFPGSSCVLVFSATSRSKICSCNPKLLLHIWFLEKCFNLFCEQLLANVSTLNFSLILNPFLLNALLFHWRYHKLFRFLEDRNGTLGRKWSNYNTKTRVLPCEFRKIHSKEPVQDSLFRKLPDLSFQLY